jgi:hypothetical protein
MPDLHWSQAATKQLHRNVITEVHESDKDGGAAQQAHHTKRVCSCRRCPN